MSAGSAATARRAASAAWRRARAARGRRTGAARRRRSRGRSRSPPGATAPRPCRRRAPGPRRRARRRPAPAAAATARPAAPAGRSRGASGSSSRRRSRAAKASIADSDLGGLDGDPVEHDAVAAELRQAAVDAHPAGLRGDPDGHHPRQHQPVGTEQPAQPAQIGAGQRSRRQAEVAHRAQHPQAVDDAQRRVVGERPGQHLGAAGGHPFRSRSRRPAAAPPPTGPARRRRTAARWSGNRASRERRPPPSPPAPPRPPSRAARRATAGGASRGASGATSAAGGPPRGPPPAPRRRRSGRPAGAPGSARRRPPASAAPPAPAAAARAAGRRCAPRQDLVPGAVGEGRLAGQHLVQDQSEGVEVAPRVGRLPPRLLRRQVRQGGGRAVAGRRQGRRDAEAGEVGVAVGVEENAARPQVAMHHALAMRCLQGRGELHRHRHRPRRIEGARLRQHLLQAPPAHQVHDDEAPLAVLPQVVDAHHVAVGDLLGEHPFAARARRRLAAGDGLRPQQLQRHVDAAPLVVGAVDPTRAAGADALADAVAARQQIAAGEHRRPARRPGAAAHGGAGVVGSVAQTVASAAGSVAVCRFDIACPDLYTDSRNSYIPDRRRAIRRVPVALRAVRRCAPPRGHMRSRRAPSRAAGSRMHRVCTASGGFPGPAAAMIEPCVPRPPPASCSSSSPPCRSPPLPSGATPRPQDPPSVQGLPTAPPPSGIRPSRKAEERRAEPPAPAPDTDPVPRRATSRVLDEALDPGGAGHGAVGRRRRAARRGERAARRRASARSARRRRERPRRPRCRRRRRAGRSRPAADRPAATGAVVLHLVRRRPRAARRRSLRAVGLRLRRHRPADRGEPRAGGRGRRLRPPAHRRDLRQRPARRPARGSSCGASPAASWSTAPWRCSRSTAPRTPTSSSAGCAAPSARGTRNRRRKGAAGR